MEEKRTAHRALVTRVLEGDGRASRAERHDAFDNATLTEPLHGLISKVAKYPTLTTDDDVAAVKASGLSEDQIFDLVVCAAAGQATRQSRNAVAAVLSNLDTAPIEEPLRATLRMLQKLTREHTVEEADMRRVLDSGVSRAQIDDALAVCFAFNTTNRLADAFGFFVPGPRGFES